LEFYYAVRGQTNASSLKIPYNDITRTHFESKYQLSFIFKTNMGLQCEAAASQAASDRPRDVKTGD
jgi:hypothetical protein